jgi:hypothetical protein
LLLCTCCFCGSPVEHESRLWVNLENAIATHATLAVCFFHGRSHDLVRQCRMEDLIQRLREALERFREAAQATFMPRPVPVPIPVRVKR